MGTGLVRRAGGQHVGSGHVSKKSQTQCQSDFSYLLGHLCTLTIYRPSQVSFSWEGNNPLADDGFPQGSAMASGVLQVPLRLTSWRG